MKIILIIIVTIGCIFCANTFANDEKNQAKKTEIKKSIQKQLEEIIVEHMEFGDATPRVMFKMLVPNSIKVKWELSEKDEEKFITITFDNKSLLQCIKDICKDAGLDLIIKKDHILIKSKKK